MFQVAKIAEVVQGISSFQTLCQANKVCQTLTYTVGKTDLREKKIPLCPLHDSLLRYKAGRKETRCSEELIRLSFFGLRVRCRLSKEREVVPLDGIVERACSFFKHIFDKGSILPLACVFETAQSNYD